MSSKPVSRQIGFGYLGTPLPQKLGIKAGMRVKFVHTPRNYLRLIEHPKVVRANSNLDFVHIFTTCRSELESLVSKLKTQISKRGMIWVSWPKGSAGAPTDLNENIVREIALDQGLVDVKVAAIDATWSGLKLVYRLKDRS